MSDINEMYKKLTLLISIIGMLLSIYCGALHKMNEIFWLPILFLPQIWGFSYETVMFEMSKERLGGTIIYLLLVPYLLGLFTAGLLYGFGSIVSWLIVPQV